MQYEASRIYRGLLDLPEGSVGPKLREMIGVGLALSEASYRDDRMHLADARARFWAAFSDVDASLFPATPQTAPAGLTSTGDPRYIAPWTALGGPIVTRPIGRAANGLPIGMLVCGQPGADRALARVACALDGLREPTADRRDVHAFERPPASSIARHANSGLLKVDATRPRCNICSTSSATRRTGWEGAVP